jgi:pimeloyl-ACP methyl ester carboxylesterase
MARLLVRRNILRSCALLVAILPALSFAQTAHAQRVTPSHLDRLNALLAGRVVDFTRNSGFDNRRYSHILGRPRDLYVYLPPHYSPQQMYPLVLWLHGAFGDEHAFLDQGQLHYLDQMIQQGRLPPMIIACPDGTLSGENRLTSDHSLYLNGKGGRMQDHLLHEVVPFLTANLPIIPHPSGRAIVGVSAGGAGALNLALKRPDLFGAVATIAGAANLRYSNVEEDYMADFNPAAYRWRTNYEPSQVVARYAGGLIPIRAERFIEPVFGGGPGVVPRVMQENPADLLFTMPPAPGELSILIAYGGRDQFNMDAQGASFAWLATTQGLWIEVLYDPDGDHTGAYFGAAQRHVFQWLAHRLAHPVAPAEPGDETGETEPQSVQRLR